MNYQFHSTWKKRLAPELNQEYFKALTSFVQLEYDTRICYPPYEQIFAAFTHCPFNKVKVVIIGQDPYHGPKQANGLCFSVKDGVKHPPSLVNIFKELQTDLNINYPQSGDLSAWAKQGVLLLNATLTVEEGKAGSHQKKGWENFTDAIIQKISEELNDVVFLLWGGYAQKKGRKIDDAKHLILKSGHPSPLSANRGFWFGNRHFSKCNSYLIEKGIKTINWSLEQS
ncbi:MAG: uracil-DNA glycosylase [Crocinitomicaceae bacterium]